MLDERTTTFSWEDDAAVKPKTEEALALVKHWSSGSPSITKTPPRARPIAAKKAATCTCAAGLTTLARRSKPTSPASTGLSASTNGTRSPPPLPLKRSKRTASTYGRKRVIDDPEPEPDDDPEPEPDDDPEPDDNDPELNDDVVRLLRTHDHYYGVGHVHQFRISLGKTLCGRKLEVCPGDLAWRTAEDINCKTCLNALKRREQP